MSRKPYVLAPATALAAQLPLSSDPDLQASAEADAPTGWLLLSDLTPHPSPSRPLTARHVIALAHSIAALGLIHPLAIDRHGVVIAGSHRYAALRLLASPDRAATLTSLCTMTKVDAESLPPAAAALPQVPPELVDRIPIRRLPFAQAEEPEAAWRVEVAENERRRDYSTAEVKAIAGRLKDQGYHLAKGYRGGRPLALPVLAALIGKSERHIRRILAEDESNRPSGLSLHERDRRSAAAALGRYRDRWGGSLTEAQVKKIRQALEVLDSLAQ